MSGPSAVYKLAEVAALLRVSPRTARAYFDDRTGDDGQPGPLRRLRGFRVAALAADVHALLDITDEQAAAILNPEPNTNT